MKQEPRIPVRPSPGGPEGPDDAPKKRWLGPLTWVIVFGLLAAAWFGVQGAEGEAISYSRFKSLVDEGRVTQVEIDEDSITGELAPTEDEVEAEGATQAEPKKFRTHRVEDPELVAELRDAGVEMEGAPNSDFGWTLLIWLFPLLFIFMLWRSIARVGQMAASRMGIGKSPAKLFKDERTGVTFEDVAGCEEAKTELREVVEFLESPERFSKLGAKIPKGVLLVGPPGTGKTLMAKAVAGEAGVAFYSLSGSDFVEMFVGVGAARVRDLFEQAKANAPCIVFIDELDAVGRRRGIHMGVVNDEREQTLNQLLVELDGFEPNSGVILLSATNRPDVLDPALLRPGRFDRQVVLDAPDQDGRLAILKVHARNKPLADGVDLRAVARVTPGFSGADLANTINEAALHAARRGSDTIGQRDFEEAVEKVIAGPQRPTRRLDDEQKRRVAIHEIGHALVGHYADHVEPVQKISIVPRGRAALGYTMQAPMEDRLLLSRSELISRLQTLLGGRAAEELVLGEVSTGAKDDLERATHLARQMVAQLGMGESTGLARYSHTTDNPMWDSESPMQRDCSDETARTGDLEVDRLLDEAYACARQRLQSHRGVLDSLVEHLLEREVIDRSTFERLIARAESGNSDEVRLTHSA